MTSILLVCGKDGISFSCKAKGHAGFSLYGKDIVCSAETILLRTAMQVLSKTSGIDFESDVSVRGLLSFSAVISKADSFNQERLLCVRDFLEEGFISLSKEFPDNICFSKQLED